MKRRNRKAQLIRVIRFYPVLALLVLALAYLLGGFSDEGDQVIPQELVIKGLYLFAAVIPLAVIIAFIFIGRQSDKAFKQNGKDQTKLAYEDAFTLPTTKMAGYKLAVITGRPPILTGLTGDTYLADAGAKCEIDKEHIPPVASCQCGFYAYKELSDAKFELSINPGAFLLYVDLYGIGFEYEGGFRAESQVVRNLNLPTRCMRCKVFPPKVFVTTFKLGFDDATWWQWQVRCFICSSSFKESDKLSFNQMQEQLKVVIS